METKILKNILELRAMEKAGFIKLLPETGTKVNTLYGGSIDCWYVDEGSFMFYWDENGDYKNEKYKKETSRQFKTKFFDGCFYPFVVEIL